MDLYVYMNEEETFTQFSNSENSVWVKEDLRYGDWTSGINGDGIFSKCHKFSPSHVSSWKIKKPQHKGQKYINFGEVTPPSSWLRMSYFLERKG